MPSGPPALPRHVRLLVQALQDPPSTLQRSEDDWDVLVRTARLANLLGTLAARIETAGVLNSLPPLVGAHLRSGLALGRHRRQRAIFESTVVARTLASTDTPLVLLKGAAYVWQGLPGMDGRLFEDIDLLVSRDCLLQVESSLIAAGWEQDKLDPYDERYYRAWSHELPPMRGAGHLLQLDVHHSIVPPIGRAKADARALMDSAVPIAGSPFRALAPVDQVLHACAHLFQDSDCAGRLRELVDIDALLRVHATSVQFWALLLDRARLHGLGRALWYAARYSSAWLGTSIPADASARMKPLGPRVVVRRTMDELIARALFPHHPDAEPKLRATISRQALLARAAWLRMPPYLVAFHALSKLLRGMRPAVRGEDLP
jgi:Uncharacterised nucleotidyltransferase